MSYETNSTNLLTLNNEPFPSTQQPQPQQQQSTSSPDAKQISKLILRSALQKANAAVQCDSTNDVLGAINAYKEAILLLERVLSTVDKENDRRRLQEIHDSYSERIRLLSTITSKLESELIDPMRDDADGEDEEEEDEDEDDEDTEYEQDKSWLSSKPNIRSSSRPSQQQQQQPQTNYMIKKVNSYSSMDSSTGHNNNIISRNQWQDNLSSPISPTASSNRYNSTHKEKPVASLPPTQLQTSKSTPTKSNATKYEEFDLEKDEYNLLGQHEPVVIKRPPRNSSRVIVKPSVTQNSNRSSISSMNSTTSSIESSTSIIEQPQMALPSLKTAKKENVAAVDENTPIPSKKSNFRARTSSLPKSSPLMQRSSSMSTMDNIIAAHEIDEEEGKIHVSSHQPAPPPPPLIINRPIVSRPSVGGSLGSMRKKAANRLSMEGLVNRNRHHGNSNSYGFVLKDQIQASPQEMEYATEQHYQQQSQPFERSDSHSSNGQSAMMDDTVLLDDQQQQQQQQQQANSHLKLILALEKSMTEGAHITQKLYIPKNLWQQPNIRLSSMDVKISACESLLNDLSRLEQWSYLDDLVSSTRLLDNFQASVDQLQHSLSKKLKRESTNHGDSTTSGSSNNPSSPSSVVSSGASVLSGGSSMIHSNSRDSMSAIGRTDSGKKTQSFMSWGTKFTKSVERMNAFSLTKASSEDQFKHYIEILQRLFLKIHTLEQWLNHYSFEKRKTRQPQFDVLIKKLINICTVINTVVGGFVVRDITVLLAKWLKRGGTWVNE